MPIYILGRLVIMINNVILPWVLSGGALTPAQMWGNFVNNGARNTMACQALFGMDAGKNL